MADEIEMNEKLRNREYDYIFKIVIVGDPGVGKSQLLSRFARNEFTLESRNTIGVEFATKILELDGKLVCAQVWDTSGEERYRTVASAYYRGAVGALIVYDITRQPTFETVNDWFDEIKRYSPEGVENETSFTTPNDGNSSANQCITTMLVGNKLDLRLQRTVNISEAQQFAKRKKIFFTEASALDATNVEEAFTLIVREVFDNVRRKELQQADTSIAGLESGSKSLTIPSNDTKTIAPLPNVVECQPKKHRKPSLIGNCCKDKAKGWCGGRFCC